MLVGTQRLQCADWQIAKNGAAAIPIRQGIMPDVILVDLMNGSELIKQVRANP
ncbi:hypothetical protein [Nitrosomonas sp.]|uniref:hypothetical protein n=1 Tax=Nitrosomonas sp. TaxID=42353 RepID=UPI0026056D71|nr:hypothetical protein [Nitrosomonas sp.]